ncbi:MAG: hypothetical protein WAX69_09115 [Victivallales bacterium]
MSDILLQEQKLVHDFRILDDKQRCELFKFIGALKKKKKQTKRSVSWDDITGKIEFSADSSISHDKYLVKK